MSERNQSAATMADIAAAAGVSVSTVSRALSGSPLVASAKVEEILRIAREAGYVVNATARNLRDVLVRNLEELRRLKPDKLIRRRREKFLRMGQFTE